MSTHKILADETISVSELRKNPGQYFTDHAIAVLSNNRPTGYVIGAEAYEALVALLIQNQETEHFTGRFRPTATRMKTIARKGAELLANASEEELGEFSE
jgi:antitoxin YafN